MVRGLVWDSGVDFFLHFPPQTFYRIKPTTPPGDNNGFWHPRTTSTPAVSADQTPTRLQYTTITTLALHLQLRFCLASHVYHLLKKKNSQHLWFEDVKICNEHRKWLGFVCLWGWQGRSQWGLWRSKCVFLAWLKEELNITWIYVCLYVYVCVHKERGRCR